MFDKFEEELSDWMLNCVLCGTALERARFNLTCRECRAYVAVGAAANSFATANDYNDFTKGGTR